MTLRRSRRRERGRHEQQQPERRLDAAVRSNAAAGLLAMALVFLGAGTTVVLGNSIEADAAETAGPAARQAPPACRRAVDAADDVFAAVGGDADRARLFAAYQRASAACKAAQQP